MQNPKSGDPTPKLENLKQVKIQENSPDLAAATKRSNFVSSRV
jgi:hypothetical protein